MDNIPSDIIVKVKASFSRDHIDGVIEHLEFYKSDLSERVMRCIIFLSEGKIDLLRHHTKQAIQDYRDVIYWAEYDRGDKRINDFTRPFST